MSLEPRMQAATTIRQETTFSLPGISRMCSEKSSDDLLCALKESGLSSSHCAGDVIDIPLSKQDKSAAELSQDRVLGAELAGMTITNPYLELLQKKIRTLRKRLRRIEATEKALESDPSARNAMDRAQLEAQEHKPEVTATLNVLEELLVSMSKVDEAGQKAKKELGDVSKHHEEKATSSFVQLIRFFYTLKELDGSKEYLDDQLTGLRGVLDRFREKLILNAEKAELTDDQRAQRDLYSDVQKLTEASTDSAYEPGSITYKEIYDHIERFTHAPNEHHRSRSTVHHLIDSGVTANSNQSSKLGTQLPVVECTSASSSARGSHNNQVPTTEDMAPVPPDQEVQTRNGRKARSGRRGRKGGKSEPTSVRPPMERESMKDLTNPPSVQVARDMEMIPGTRTMAPLPIIFPVHAPGAPMPRPIHLMVPQPLPAYQPPHINYQFAASYPKVHDQRTPSPRQQAQRIGSGGIGEEMDSLGTGLDGEHIGHGKGHEHRQVSSHSRRQGLNQVPGLEQTQPPFSTSQRPSELMHMASTLQQPLVQNDQGLERSHIDMERQADEASQRQPQHQHPIQRGNGSSKPHTERSKGIHGDDRIPSYPDIQLQPAHVLHHPFVHQQQYHHIPHYYYPEYRVPCNFGASNIGSPEVQGVMQRFPPGRGTN